MPLFALSSRARCLLLPALLLLCLLVSVFEGNAAEAINEFISTVTVHPDGSMRVREEYTVTAEGEQIRRGIYRDFPLRYSGPEAYRGLVPFTVVSATLDDRPLDTGDTSRLGDVIRIFMRGSKPLDKGRHRFVLEYDTSLHLRRYENHDELNWNATGVWAFRIDKFSCRIILPKGVPVEKTIAWLGKGGTKNTDEVEISRPAANQAEFSGKKVFDRFDTNIMPGEQLTVAVSFPKGAIADPMPAFLERQKAEEAEREARRAEYEASLAEAEARRAAEEKDAAEMGILSLALYNCEFVLYNYPGLPLHAGIACLVFLYFLVCWWRVGRDPAKGTIIPRFHPPMAPYMGKGKPPEDFTLAPMSPLGMQFLRNHGNTTNQGLAALLLCLAVKKLCAIGKTEDGLYVLRPRPLPQSGQPALSPEERAAHEKLTEEASPDGELILSPKQEAMRSIRSAANSPVDKNYKAAWALNSWVSVLGWLLILPLAYTVCFWDADLPVQNSGSMELPGPALVFLVSWTFTLVSGLAILSLRTAGLSVVSLLLCIFPAAGIVVLWSEGFFSGPYWIAPAAMLAVACVFSILMKAPSKAARAALDEIEGMAMYMDAAEKDRLEMLNRPEDTPRVFQTLLPYALVLGLEKTWCDRFADQIAAGLMTDSDIDQDIISDRHSWEHFAVGLSAAVAASTVVESSSSSSSESAFSSGGGGSGSGSGGGGGGGC